jgi:hypothetical protein
MNIPTKNPKIEKLSIAGVLLARFDEAIEVAQVEEWRVSGLHLHIGQHAFGYAVSLFTN